MVTSKVNGLIEKFSNQYFYSEKVGVYLINLRNKTILFDLPTYSEEIKKYLLSRRKPLIAFLSHGATGIADGSLWQKKIGLKVYLHKKDKDHNWLRMSPDVLFVSADIDEKVEVIHTPGDSPGSICLLEKTTKTLLTGDTVEGTRDGYIYDFTQNTGENIGQRLESCRKLLKYDFKHILPFHYEPIFNSAKEVLKKFVKEKAKMG